MRHQRLFRFALALRSVLLNSSVVFETPFEAPYAPFEALYAPFEAFFVAFDSSPIALFFYRPARTRDSFKLDRRPWVASRNRDDGRVLHSDFLSEG